MSSRLALAMSASALVVALLGSTPLGHAIVSNVPRNSVGPLQLKRNAVGPQKLAPNAIRTNHVLNGSLLASDFKAGQLPAGPAGAPGPAGPAGPAGPTGPAGVSLRQVVTAVSAHNSGFQKLVTANCPAGKQVLGGGASLNGATEPMIYVSRPEAAGWTALALETTATPASWNLTAWAVCARVT